jgi:hypothetical protein
MINIKPPIDARKRTPNRTLMLIISGQRAAGSGQPGHRRLTGTQPKDHDLRL